MRLEFEGEIFHWRGPAPYLFVAVPEEASQIIKDLSAQLTYGWGVIPVRARLGGTEWSTSLIPKDGRYLLPIRASVQTAEKVGAGDWISVQMEVGRK